MPDIIFRLEDALGHVPIATLDISPTIRFIEGKTVVIPNHLLVPVISNPMTLHLAPTNTTWCWRISEKSSNLQSRYFLVPDVPGPIEYADLVQVDPATLTPTAQAPPIWIAALADLQARLLIGYGTSLPSINVQEGDSFDLYTP